MEYHILDKINGNADLKSVPAEDIPSLCAELRDFMVGTVSKTGGHLASNLGAVELTVALHRIYDPEKDRILFDVGHQAYVHKLLTGRRDRFDTLRSLNGIAGFPKPCESSADPMVAGHASDSVSAALGMARARTLRGEDYHVVAVIGDGALTGGLSFEGLSDAGSSGETMVVIVNDNGMAIKRNVGGMAALLRRARCRPEYIHFKQSFRSFTKDVPEFYQLTHKVKEWVKPRLMPPGLFDSFGFYTIGPIDGHNEPELEYALSLAKSIQRPVLIHVVTVKGKGYSFAENDPELYHGVGPFDRYQGVQATNKKDFSSVFGEELVSIGEKNHSVVAVTAAMESGTGLSDFAARYPMRYFELGIAEEHAVTMCAGMAKQGLIPIFAVYSSFLQRSYDMLIENVGIMGLHVVFAIDRAGLVGQDGVTHHGSFDLAYLGTVPGMTVYAPSSFAETRSMLALAINEHTGPVALRYPRGGEGSYREDHSGDAATVLKQGADLTVITHGIVINEVLAAADELERSGISCEIIKLNRVFPLPAEEALTSLKKTKRLLCVEDCCRAGSCGERLLSCVAREGLTLKAVRQLDLRSGVVSHGKTQELYHTLGMDAAGIVCAATEMLHEENSSGSACI